MTSRNLREFTERLQREGQLLRISTPLSRDLEITEIVDRVSTGPPEKNKALLFEKVNGFSIPVAINLLGSAQRRALARCSSGGRIRRVCRARLQLGARW